MANFINLNLDSLRFEFGRIHVEMATTMDCISNGDQQSRTNSDPAPADHEANTIDATSQFLI